MYSFGIILWEILMEKEPFSGVSFSEIKKIVTVDNKRPLIID